MALIVMQWNARSIYKKLPELKQFLSGLPVLPDVIWIQEIYLAAKYNPFFQNYAILHKDRPPFRGKGVVD